MHVKLELANGMSLERSQQCSTFSVFQQIYCLLNCLSWSLDNFEYDGVP